jgi:alpha-beta hydrolase superfamily lysophospholipase
VHDRLSARLGLDILLSGEWALDHATDFSLPLLLMHGNADRLTSPDASREFAARAGAVCTLIVWDGFYHEIHNEPEQSDVFNAILTWLDERIGAANPET